MKKNLIIAASVAALAFGGAFATIANDALVQTAFVAVKQFATNPTWSYVQISALPNSTCDQIGSANCTVTINLTGGRTAATTAYTDAAHTTILKDASANGSTGYNVSAPYTPEVVQ